MKAMQKSRSDLHSIALIGQWTGQQWIGHYKQRFLADHCMKQTGLTLMRQLILLCLTSVTSLAMTSIALVQNNQVSSNQSRIVYDFEKAANANSKLTTFKKPEVACPCAQKDSDELYRCYRESESILTAPVGCRVVADGITRNGSKPRPYGDYANYFYVSSKITKLQEVKVDNCIIQPYSEEMEVIAYKPSKSKQIEPLKATKTRQFETLKCDGLWWLVAQPGGSHSLNFEDFEEVTAALKNIKYWIARDPRGLDSEIPRRELKQLQPIYDAYQSKKESK